MFLLYLFMIMPRILGRPKRKPYLGVYYAHRGLHDNRTSAPENSMPAFRKAVEAGYGIELDVQLTKDGIPVIFHDFTLEWICGVSGKPGDYTFEELQEMKLLQTKKKIPSLQEFLEMVDGKKQNEKVYTIGGLELNEETIEVFVDGSPVKLTPLEFKILLLLMKNPGRVFSAEEIYERVWNEQAINTDTIMVHIRKIREKIEVNPREPKYLKVVWGIGYKIEKQ